MKSAKTVVVLGALCTCLLAPSQAPAAPAAGWKLTALTLPTNLIPGTKSSIFGPAYYPVATNIGTAPSSGEIVFNATLPAGVTPVDASGVASNPFRPAPTCEDPIVGQTVTCKTEAVVDPGNWVGIKVGVNVDPLATGTLSAEASVEGGGGNLVETTTETTITSTPAPFSFLYFDSSLTGEEGATTTLSGSHPERLTVDLAFPVQKVGTSSLSGTEPPREVIADLPRGVIINPTATPVRCTEAQLTSASCPLASQVGAVTIMTLAGGANPITTPLYNMIPPPGAPGSFGFDAVGVGIFVHLLGSVRSDGDYGLTGTVSDILARPPNPVLSAQTQLWGDPTSPVHDGIRECPTYGDCPLDPSERTDVAMLAMPTECSGEPLVSKVRARSWENPGVFKAAIHETADPLDGCNQLEFKPSIEVEPTTNLVDSPSGLRFDLHQPQDFTLDGRSTAALKDALVTLPQGMVANPSQAAGLEACSPTEIGLATPLGQSAARFDKDPASCPDAAKLGKVVVSTPLLEDPLPGEGGLGAVYLAEPFQNPFGSLLAIYIVIDDPETGTVAKLAGKVIPDPVSGQLSTRFEENPQLPLEDIELEFFEGPRAPLRTPPTCTSHTVAANFTPWSSPEAPDAPAADSFTPSAAPGGGACPTSAAAAPHAPVLGAGSLSPQAGAYSPFVLALGRDDGTQEIAGLETVLPPGLSAKLAGVSNCPEAAIAAAKAREAPNQGALEIASPSCPAASRVATVTVAAGAGPSPFYVQGSAYLAGPYKSAPLSLVVITPAVAGPFDLGAVVVRAALHVNPTNARVRAVSDPLPTILQGIPLDLRSATVSTNRPQFTLNPTSCDPMAVQARVTSVFGALASPSSHFQVGGCQALPFKPKLELRLLGGTRRGAHPKLRATLTAKPGEANIARTSVALPRSEFLDQSHIRTVCTRVQFAAEQCPAGAIYGHVRAFTPLLEEPLEGPIYLRSSDNELPDTVGVLRGPPSRPVQIEVAARIDSFKRGIRANFEAVPDAPITKVVVMMNGGRKGLLINSANLCGLKAAARRATVKMDGQNAKAHDFRPLLKNDCAKRRKASSKRRPSR
jgi:hypothetical protein